MIAPTPENIAPLPAAPINSALPPFWCRMETLWLWMPALCALLYALCLPLAPNDLWYHVRAGELIFARGAIPTQNLMSTQVPLGAPYYYQSWLAEFVLFATLKLGGLSALSLLRSFFVAGALLLTTIATFRFLLRLPRAPSRLLAARLSAFGAVIGLLMASNNVDLRPQVFSLFFFGAWIFAVLEFRAAHLRKRTFWSAFLIILTWIWANTHGAFIISLLGLTTFAILDFLWRRENWRFSLAVALASCAIVLINPRGAALYVYVAGLSNNEIGQKFIQEWKSPAFDEWHSVLFWICAALIGFLWVATQLWKTQFPQKMKPSEMRNEKREIGALIFPAALFFAMAARDQRSIVWFALWFAPVSALLMCSLVREKTPSIAPVPRGALMINAVLLICLALFPIALFPQFKANWPWPPEFRQRFAPTPLFFGNDPSLLIDSTTPVVAAQFLIENPPRGRLFTDMVCGSYLTYAGRGQIRPLCDPRIELFPVAFWEDYLRLSDGPADAVSVLETRGFSDVLLDKKNMPALVARLEENARWRVVAQNGSTLLFRFNPI